MSGLHSTKNPSVIMKPCAYCSKEFKYESEKKRHEQSHVPQFECQECCKKFSFLSALRRHQKQHERTGSVVCSICGRSFRDDILLKRHIKYAHKGVSVCSKCDAKFNSELALSSHMKSHKPKAERRFKCKYSGCNKSFNFTHHLKHHELTHSNEKQHRCEICGKGFIQFHHYKAHLKSHVSNDWLYCPAPNCNKKFLTAYSRKRHLATHKNMLDSGISSDSNCDISQDSTTGLTHCVSCDQMIKLSLYEIHKGKCTAKEVKPKDKPLKLLSSIELNNNNANEPKFSNCKTLLGRCIVSEDSSDNICLCAQIKTDVDIYDIASPIEPVSIQEPKHDESLRDKSVSDNMCNGCLCSNANGCNYESADINNDIPQIEYSKSGVIKIKNTFDLKIENVNIENKILLNDTTESFKSNNFVPYNSCKAVLGKCIVSGNGTISEECLCAKMAMDDDTLIEQEIDEITPQPTTTAV